ncbi:DUF2971 domain-containing protein [Pseudomonas syringae]|uniref:DUF2971 domain-containing protein n=1 Tax=Pseudomonas syringae TaxID=317 RepID=UPI000E32BE31|nr:DUF2971 domain-containing protein [Pseudomonas syringae]
MSIEENIHAVVWGDVETKGDSHNRPPLLSHYTSVAVLEGMMANDEIWFSHPLYMNDSEELRFGMIEGANAFRNSAELKAAFKDDQLYNDLLAHFNYMFSEFDLNHVFDTYIMCLAKHDPEDRDGLLSMWRGYGAGGSGVAIVFDTSKIRANEESPFIIDAVQYMTTEDRLDWIFERIKGMAEVLTDTTPTDQDLYCTAYYWIERLKIFALFTKHKGFHEEKEWRIVYMNERDKQGRLKDMLGYAITPRGVEPKLKFKVKPLEGMFGEHLSLEGVIDRIILGPTTSTVMAANSVKRLLQQKGKLILAEKIVPSTIPFRL